MERVEGFRKNNVGVVTERFTFDAMQDFKLVGYPGGLTLKIAVGDEPYKRAVSKGSVEVSFDERDRKAVADLFRKMADSLDPQDELFKPGSTGRVSRDQYLKGFMQSYDEETGLNSVRIGNTLLNNLRVINKPVDGYKVDDQVVIIRVGSRYGIFGRLD